MSEPSRTGRIGELARLFFKLGIIGFGGPAAHIAMMEEEVVERRGWIDRQYFLDLIGATNLIPGPNSTEMTMHVGYARAGWLGLAVAGLSFIIPAASLTVIFAWMYVRFGTMPAVEPFLVGIKPAVLAVILGALWRLGRKAVKGMALTVLGVGVGALLLFGLGEVSALLLGGLVGMLVLVAIGAGARPAPPSGRRNEASSSHKLAGFFIALQPLAAGAAASVGGVTLWKLGFYFLKVGAVLYGSGYVIIAFIEGDLVEGYGWLTQKQLLDAVAVGQLTPGPVLTTATFIGYILAGVPGAIVATLCIFLPSFVFVGLLHPIIPRLRKSRWTAAFLDAINVSAVALMAVVTLSLGRSVLIGWVRWCIFILAAFLIVRYKVNALWLVGGGAFVGGLAATMALI
ncbi:MAG: chromate efflux transporter [Bacteroidetes bacterium]|nr:chromate efflux transporter [Bacteroidota bacterium]